MVELDAIRYVVDENTLALGRAMAALRDDTAVIGHPPVDGLIQTGMEDVHWIPIVASRGWVVITIDHHLRTRPREAALALEHGLKCVNLRSAGNLNRWSQLVRLAGQWEAIESFTLSRPAGPWWLSISRNSHRELDYKPGKLD